VEFGISLDGNLLPLLIFWRKRFVDWLSGLHCNG